MLDCAVVDRSQAYAPTTRPQVRHVVIRCDDYELTAPREFSHRHSMGLATASAGSSGTIHNHYAYNTWATLLPAVRCALFGTPSGMLDRSAGLYEMGERYYHPCTGRFTRQDQLGGGYACADGHPINEADSSGLYADPFQEFGQCPGGGNRVRRGRCAVGDRTVAGCPLSEETLSAWRLLLAFLESTFTGLLRWQKYG